MTHSFSICKQLLLPTDGIVISIVHFRFSKNRTQCVLPMSRLFFVCPNTVTIVTRLQSSYSRPQYENLWLVSKQGFERCEVNKSIDRNLKNCDKPLVLHYYEVIFKRFSADTSAPTFQPGKDYYFIGELEATV